MSLNFVVALSLEPHKVKSDPVFTFSLPICHEVIEQGAKILVF